MSVKQIDGYKIRMNQKLGTGSYGSVYVGESDTTHKRVAIKILPKQQIDSDDYLKSALFQEIKIMQSVKNPNIVQFVDVMQSSKNYYLIQQLCDGDISKYMKPGKQIPEADCINMLFQICNGFLALVREGIVHRDLKPANIMIKDNILKIGDFGFAKKIPNQKFKNQTIVGTPLYMSLEILKSEDYTSKCDIWALGFIFYEMLHGTTPWTAKSEYELVKNITNKPLKIKRSDLHKNTIDFIQRTLQIKQEQRISWDELFLHPIFQGFFDDKGGKNQIFENKLNSIMNDLRFYIKSNNLDLCKILYNLGYTDDKQQFNFEQYYHFLITVNPEIKREQALYVFRHTDTDNSNSISIVQIQQLLKKHSISFTSTFKSVPKFKKQQKAEEETFAMISEQVQTKISNCFTRLYKIIQKNRITLRKVFNDFDKKKQGRLSQKQFMYMMSKLDHHMPEQQVIQAFNLIDEDGSKTLQYEQLNKYYCKVNGIPTQPSTNYQPMDVQHLSSSQKHMSNSQSSNSSNNSQNPLARLKTQNSFPQQYHQQQYHQQYNQMHNMGNMNMGNMNMGNMNMGGYYPQNMMFMPQNQPQGGLFGNFVMNQLSQRMNNPNQQPYQPPRW